MILRQPKKAAESSYDLVVVGGGVYGAMLVLEAARRGLKPLLLEKSDFGGATTWNSLRIIHGGLRYLQTLDFRRFFESVGERKWFLKNFPDLVRPLPCLMPLYDKGFKRTGVLAFALSMNDRLSRKRNDGLEPEQVIPQGRILDVAETLSLFPAVRENGLHGGALWYDAVMPNSQRLLMEILRWASACGATSLNYVEAKRLLLDGKAIAGVQAVDLHSGDILQYSASTVINCAGPWSRQLARSLDRDIPKVFFPSLAFNVLLDREALSKVALAVSPKDQQKPNYFLLPWEDKILAGTYHVPWREEFGQREPDEALVRSFLTDLNASLPGFEVKSQEILRIYWGLLPAVAEGSKDLALREVIHKHAASGGPSGLFTVSGVKFTTARLVAEKALRLIYGGQLRTSPAQKSAERPPTLPYLHLSEFDQLCSTNQDAATAHLQRLVDEESVIYLEDLILRRTNWGMDPKNVEVEAQRVCALMGCSQGEKTLLSLVC
jgi:glycerol-3-phosphate dehydrogenase